MGVATLRAELRQRGVKIPPKAVKAEMQKLLKEVGIILVSSSYLVGSLILSSGAKSQ